MDASEAQKKENRISNSDCNFSNEVAAVPSFAVQEASDEEEEKKALAAAMDEWNKVVNIHNLKHLI